VIGIRLSDLRDKIEQGKRPRWAMRWVRKHADHYADESKSIAVIPVEKWNTVLEACNEKPEDRAKHTQSESRSSRNTGREDLTGCQSCKDRMMDKMKAND